MIEVKNKDDFFKLIDELEEESRIFKVNHTWVCLSNSGTKILYNGHK